MIRSPLLWSGSKFDLLPEIIPRITGRLWEPFCGSAVVSLNYQGESVISDRCAPLMNFWAQVKAIQAGEQVPFSIEWPLGMNERAERAYYRERDWFNNPNISDTPRCRAQSFLYLNRTCWRGLYRENSKGEFNVPWGARKRVEWPAMPDMSRITVLRAFDCLEPSPGLTGNRFNVACDTIYCDPPYVGTHSYGVKFDHERFAAWCRSRSERVLVSNSPTAVDLFPGWEAIELTAKGGIGHNRKEVLLWNRK